MTTPTVPTCDFILSDGTPCTNIATQKCGCSGCSKVVCIKHWVPRVHAVISGTLQEGPGRCQSCADKFNEDMKKGQWVESVSIFGSIIKGIFGR